MDAEVDRVLKKVGGYHPYQLTIFGFLLLSICWPWCYQNLNVVFIGYTPPHHCKVPANQTLNETIPYTIENGQIVWDKCRMYANFSLDNSTVPCTNGWTYYTDGYTSIVTEWDLVCDKNYVADMILAIYQGCCLAAEIGVSYFVDRWGRKPLHVGSMTLVALTGSLMAFSTNVPMLVTIRGITAILVVSGLLSGLTLLMELFDTSKRAFAGIGLEAGWLVAFLPMALFAWLIPDWRNLQLALSAINVVWIVYIWILHESVPWLLVTGKYRKANKILNTMARWNMVRLEEPVMIVPETQMDDRLLRRSDDVTESTPDIARTDVTLKDVLQLVKNPILRKHLLVSMGLWFANCIVYYEITLVTPLLPGDRFFNFFIMSVIEIPSYLLSYYIVMKYGRRLPTCIFHILAGLPLFCVVFIPKQTAAGFDLGWLTILLVVMAKFCISASFAIMLLYTKELFPTCLRATSGGGCNVAGRIGSILAPMVVYAGKTRLYWLPSILCGVISIVIGVVLLVLPDTSNIPLPQTIEDVTKMYTKPQKKSASKDHKEMDSLKT